VDRLLWAGQLLLAVVFAVFGVLHAFLLDETKKQVAWVNDVPRELMLFIGLAELAAAVGLVVPAARVLRWAAPLAALGLVVLMTFGIVFHIGLASWRTPRSTWCWPRSRRSSHMADVARFRGVAVRLGGPANLIPPHRGGQA
jgi:uncharacterized membrane protein